VYLEERNERGLSLLPFSGYRTTIRQFLCQLTEVLGVVQISLTYSHFAVITNSPYVHVSPLEGFFLLGKEERCHQTITFRKWNPSKVPVRHFQKHLTIPIFNSGCHWLLYWAGRHVRAKDFSFLSAPPQPSILIPELTERPTESVQGGGGLSGMKRLGHEADRALPCSVDVNTWVHTSTPTNVFVMRWLIQLN